MQLSALASSQASLVFPIPAGPVNNSACDNLSASMADFSVPIASLCPMMSHIAHHFRRMEAVRLVAPAAHGSAPEQDRSVVFTDKSPKTMVVWMVLAVYEGEC
jgi:hypothetical protein